jgi:hypothetical protein
VSPERLGGTVDPLVGFLPVAGAAPQTTNRRYRYAFEERGHVFFASYLSSKANCIASFPAVLDNIFLMHSANR